MLISKQTTHQIINLLPDYVSLNALVYDVTSQFVEEEALLPLRAQPREQFQGSTKVWEPRAAPDHY